MNDEMQRALEADGEKLRHLTGEDHGPFSVECPPCTYCQNPSRLMDGREIAATYAGRAFFKCDPCDAWVGVYPGSNLRPKGRFANKFLRREKKEAFGALDRVTRIRMQLFSTNYDHARTKTYGWLAEQMMIPKYDCHINNFDEEQCKQTVVICMAFVEKFKGEQADVTTA